MKITQIVSSVEGEASGPSYTVPRLSQSLSALRHDVHLMTLGRPGEKTDGKLRHTRYRQDFVGLPGISRLGVSRDLRKALDEEADQTDVFHAHGLWMMSNIYSAWSARKAKKPLVLSARGMLGPAALQFSANRKRLFWALRQRAAVQTVRCFHATCEEEYHDIRAYGLPQPVAIIPNGIDVPDLKKTTPALPAPSVLSLGRVHPKKALDQLILAWREIESDYSQWQLMIVGPDEGGYSDELAKLTKRLRLKNVSITGPVFGEEKLALYRRSELFVLSTLHENFGMTVAESLAASTPVISTKGAPWVGLEENKCGWWIDHGVEPLAAALREAMSLPDKERRAMGARGRAWMERDFAWDGIAGQMTEVYQWLLGRGERPAWVRT